MTNAGSGHKMGAEAVQKSFEMLYGDKYEVKTVDLFKVFDVDPFNTSDISYAFVAGNRALETLNNLLFRGLNTYLGYQIYYSYVRNRLLNEAKKWLQEEKPDVIICNHPVVASIINALKTEVGGFKSVQIVLDLVTIFRGWGDESADLIFSPTSEAVNTLVRYGVDVAKIVYPLFPVHPKLKNFRKKEELIEEMGFNTSKPVVLMTGGGVGSGSLKNAIHRLTNTHKYQVIVSAGKSEYLKDQLERKYKDRKDVKILGYVDNMPDLYNLADVVVAKPSSATVIESELFEKRVVFTRYIGEQDAGNVDYVLRNPKCRYIGTNWDKLEETLDDLLNANFRDPAVNFKREFDECEKIVKEIVKFIEESA